jgi:hypothetical protein
MRAKEVTFPCLNCGADTGCANRLLCDDCRAKEGRGRSRGHLRGTTKGRPHRILRAAPRGS